MARCTATAKSTGNQCQKQAIAGGTVCIKHGGAAPQVKAKAQLRLAQLVNPAIVTLGRILADPMASDAAKLRAVENVLDRTGYPRSVGLDVEKAKDDLLARLDVIDVQALPEGDAA